jgi:ATP-dependent metalloprotease FtsH
MRKWFNKRNLITLIASLLLVILSLIAYLYKPVETIDLNTYQQFLQNNLFKKATIVGNRVVLSTDEGDYSIIRSGIDIGALLHKVPVEIDESEAYTDAIILFILLGMLIGFALLFGKKEQELQTTAKPKERMDNFVPDLIPGIDREILPVTSDVTFDDVAGIDEVKEELYEIVDFLKHREKYSAFGVKMPRGVLLAGPPGVGKTLIAKAVAGEAGVPFFYQSGSAFVQIYVGMGAKRVRELFAVAKRYAPSIIFIDEIDAVGKARGGGRNDERESTLNQLLTQMDGFEDSSNVIVIAATNQYEMLDNALLRAGRFDRRIFVSLPGIKEREAILKVHLKGKSTDVDVSDLAKMSVGFSGAALSTFVNEAAINALRHNRSAITYEDFNSVKEKVLLGKKKILSYSHEEKVIQATYQAAKALSAHWYEVDFEKVSLIEEFLIEMEKEITSRTQLSAKLKVYLAGYVASQLYFEEVYTNCAADIKKAKQITEEMVQVYAMGDGVYAAPVDSASLIDDAIEDLEQFLYKMKPAVETLRNALLEKETLSKEELGEIVSAFL